MILEFQLILKSIYYLIGQDNYDILDHISDDIINLKFLEMLLNNIEKYK